jgi:hypothetical protein
MDPVSWIALGASLNRCFLRRMHTGHQNEPTDASVEAVYVWNLSHTCCRQNASHCCVLLPYDTLQNWDDLTSFHICHKGNLSQPFVPARFEKLKCNSTTHYKNTLLCNQIILNKQKYLPYKPLQILTASCHTNIYLDIMIH